MPIFHRWWRQNGNGGAEISCFDPERISRMVFEFGVSTEAPFPLRPPFSHIQYACFFIYDICFCKAFLMIADAFIRVFRVSAKYIQSPGESNNNRLPKKGC